MTADDRKDRAVDATTTVNEEALVSRAREGHIGSFTALVTLHQERAVHAAFAIVGNFEDARDITQEAFVKAYESIRDFGGESRFYTWFYRILANCGKDFLRKKKVRRNLSAWFGWRGEPDDPPVDAASPAPDAAEAAMNRELGNRIFEAMERLPLRQRLAFSLRYLDGMSLEEVANSMRLTVGAAKANLWQAAQKMKHYLEEAP